MHRYESMDIIGEGAYSIVHKCRHKEVGQLVAIKKFIEPDEDATVKKIALREVKILKMLRHENLIALLEVFKKKKHYYLVFEFMDHTVLDELEASTNGLEENKAKIIMWQVLQAIRFCHLNGVVHRDIKPENVLISDNGVVKLCDFGFARKFAVLGEIYTDYVATRWYRAPELLVGGNQYNKTVDIWSIGCLFAELLSSDPLFPGDSDIDQIYHITKCLGNLITHHRELFNFNQQFRGVRLPNVRKITPLRDMCHRLTDLGLDLVQKCLALDPRNRPDCDKLLDHSYFRENKFREISVPQLTEKITTDYKQNILLQRLGVLMYGSAFRPFPSNPIQEEFHSETRKLVLQERNRGDSMIAKKRTKKQQISIAKPSKELSKEPITMEIICENIQKQISKNENCKSPKSDHPFQTNNSNINNNIDSNATGIIPKTTIINNESSLVTLPNDLVKPIKMELASHVNEMKRSDQICSSKCNRQSILTPETWIDDSQNNYSHLRNNNSRNMIQVELPSNHQSITKHKLNGKNTAIYLPNLLKKHSSTVALGKQISQRILPTPIGDSINTKILQWPDNRQNNSTIFNLTTRNNNNNNNNNNNDDDDNNSISANSKSIEPSILLQTTVLPQINHMPIGLTRDSSDEFIL